MRIYEHVVRHLREEINAGHISGQTGERPITDLELVNVLLAMKHWSAAEWLLEQMHSEEAAA